MSSSWKLESQKTFPKLDKEVSTDVCIVGGGLTGVWCAYLLAKMGKKVVLIDKGRIGSGMTEYTTAFITQHIDTPLFRLTRMFGTRAAQEVWNSGGAAIDLIDKTIKEENIDCEWMRLPLHVYARTWREYQDLQREYGQARDLGVNNVKLTYRFNPGFKTKGALEIQEQAKYHPLKFLMGLVKAAEKYGAVFYEETEGASITSGEGARVLTRSGHKIEARHAITATYWPFGNPNVTHFKKGMYRSYVLELEVKKGMVKEGMYIDMHSPYHYIRVDNTPWEKARVIVGGEDHRSELSIEEESFKALKRFVASTFKGIDYKIVREWKGGILESSDGLPFIGEVERNVYTAFAFSGNGMTYAPLAGMILTGMITGEENEFAYVYDVDRHIESLAVLNKFIDYTQVFLGGAAKNFFRR